MRYAPTQVTPVVLCSLKAFRALAMPLAARTDTEVERIAHMRVTCGNGFERTNEYNRSGLTSSLRAGGSLRSLQRSPLQRIVSQAVVGRECLPRCSRRYRSIACAVVTSLRHYVVPVTTDGIREMGHRRHGRAARLTKAWRARAPTGPLRHVGGVKAATSNKS